MKTLFAKGRSVFSSALGMKIRPNTLPHSRFVVVVGVKVDKRAVVRNRLKRRVRAIIHEYLGSIRSGFDIGLLPRRGAIELSAEMLKKEIVGALKKGRLL